jgi:hypothetical protein
MTVDKMQALQDELLADLKCRLDEFWEHCDRSDYEDKYGIVIRFSWVGREADTQTILAAAKEQLDRNPWLFTAHPGRIETPGFRETFCKPFLEQARCVVEEDYLEALRQCELW